MVGREDWIHTWILWRVLDLLLRRWTNFYGRELHCEALVRRGSDHGYDNCNTPGEETKESEHAWSSSGEHPKCMDSQTRTWIHGHVGRTKFCSKFSTATPAPYLWGTRVHVRYLVRSDTVSSNLGISHIPLAIKNHIKNNSIGCCCVYELLWTIARRVV